MSYLYPSVNITFSTAEAKCMAPCNNLPVALIGTKTIPNLIFKKLCWNLKNSHSYNADTWTHVPHNEFIQSILFKDKIQLNQIFLPEIGSGNIYILVDAALSFLWYSASWIEFNFPSDMKCQKCYFVSEHGWHLSWVVRKMSISS